MNLGIIGCGNFGRKYVSTIQSMTGVTLAAVCTTNPENLKLWDESVNVVSTYRELCAQSLNGVIICTPPKMHCEIMHHCFDIGMPFIVEKPICMSSEEMSKIKWRSRFGLPCLVDYTNAFSPAFTEMLDRFKDVHGGNIYSSTQSFGPFREDVPMIWDWLPHDVSMTLMCMKEFPKRVRMDYIPNCEHPNSGTINAEIEFNNSLASFSINNISHMKARSFKVDRGLDLNENHTVYKVENNNLTIYRGEKEEHIKVPIETPLQNVILHFLSCITTRVQLGITLSVYITRIIELMETSNAMNGAWVDFS